MDEQSANAIVAVGIVLRMFEPVKELERAAELSQILDDIRTVLTSVPEDAVAKVHKSIPNYMVALQGLVLKMEKLSTDKQRKKFWNAPLKNRDGALVTKYIAEFKDIHEKLTDVLRSDRVSISTANKFWYSYFVDATEVSGKAFVQAYNSEFTPLNTHQAGAIISRMTHLGSLKEIRKEGKSVTRGSFLSLAKKLSFPFDLKKLGLDESAPSPPSGPKPSVEKGRIRRLSLESAVRVPISLPDDSQVFVMAQESTQLGQAVEDIVRQSKLEEPRGHGLVYQLDNGREHIVFQEMNAQFKKIFMQYKMIGQGRFLFKKLHFLREELCEKSQTTLLRQLFFTARAAVQSSAAPVTHAASYLLGALEARLSELVPSKGAEHCSVVDFIPETQQMAFETPQNVVENTLCHVLKILPKNSDVSTIMYWYLVLTKKYVPTLCARRFPAKKKSVSGPPYDVNMLVGAGTFTLVSANNARQLISVPISAVQNWKPSEDQIRVYIQRKGIHSLTFLSERSVALGEFLELSVAFDQLFHGAKGSSHTTSPEFRGALEELEAILYSVDKLIKEADKLPKLAPWSTKKAVETMPETVAAKEIPVVQEVVALKRVAEEEVDEEPSPEAPRKAKPKPVTPSKKAITSPLEAKKASSPQGATASDTSEVSLESPGSSRVGSPQYKLSSPFSASPKKPVGSKPERKKPHTLSTSQRVALATPGTPTTPFRRFNPRNVEKDAHVFRRQAPAGARPIRGSGMSRFGVIKQLRESATRIQRQYKTYKEREQFIAMRNAAVKVQATQRMHYLRVRFVEEREAALRIQTFWRANHARREYRGHRRSLIALQRCYAERHGKRVSAAVKVQATWRAVVVARKYRRVRANVILIQRAWRGHRVRSLMRAWTSAVKVIARRYRLFRWRKERNAAATKIQAAWRGHHEITRLATGRWAVVKIQSIFRAARVRSNMMMFLSDFIRQGSEAGSIGR